MARPGRPKKKRSYKRRSEEANNIESEDKSETTKLISSVRGEEAKIKNMMTTKPVSNKSIVVTFRILQSICFGVFALGLAMGLGDYGKAVSWPFSNISITTTVFGLIGALITGNQAKACEKW